MNRKSYDAASSYSGPRSSSASSTSATSSGSRHSSSSGSRPSSSSGAGSSSSTSTSSSSSTRSCGKCGKQDSKVNILCHHCGKTYHGDCCVTYYYGNKPGAWKLVHDRWRCDGCYEKGMNFMGTQSREGVWKLFKTMKNISMDVTDDFYQVE